ncbi:MAG: SDR family oxidoreductase [Gammaproteobacteria bacterium]|nr:SDR family oxidoreductase [Gammaproteobacteria bacterium]
MAMRLKDKVVLITSGAIVRGTIDATHPMGRKGKLEEIAQAALYLASDEASWTTGAILTVDGDVMAQ